MADEVGGGGCSTAVVRGLADQLVGQLNCLYPDTLETFDEGGQIEFASGAVIGSIQPGAVRGLEAALADRAGSTITITSALRALPQQYLLYQWYRQGRCGIQIAASPGNSNHEGGLAIDVQNHDAWRGALEDHGWDWYGSGDVVHFTYVAAGEDIRSASVLAFQTLWNANHPNDTIDEDGQYGPQTESRLDRAPTGGFEIGTTCTPCSQGLHARFDGAEAPPDAIAGETFELLATFTNTGDATWVAGEVVLAADPPVPLGGDVIEGGSTTFTFTVTAAQEGPMTVSLFLADALGAPIPAGCEGAPSGQVVVNVLPAPVDPAPIDDGDDGHGEGEGDPDHDPAWDGPTGGDDPGSSVGLLGGSCAVGGRGASVLPLIVAVLVVVATARRRGRSSGD